MKSERRHQLEQNELADWLAAKIEAVKPYQNVILGLVLLVVVVTVGYTIYTRQAAGKTAQGWDEFYQAVSDGRLNPADFDDIIEKYPDTTLAHWAGVVVGDLRLAFGCDQLFVNKAGANQELRHAVDHYMRVRQQSRNSMLRERATFGLARAREALGELDAAIKCYQDVDRDWPNGAYAAQAKRRLEDLGRPATKQMYDRFAKFDPKPDYADEPGTPGDRLPFSLDSLPEGDGPLFTPKLMDLEEKGVEDDRPQDVPESGKRKGERGKAESGEMEKDG